VNKIVRRPLLGGEHAYSKRQQKENIDGALAKSAEVIFWRL
jgi:hypothetical protein